MISNIQYFPRKREAHTKITTIDGRKLHNIGHPMGPELQKSRWCSGCGARQNLSNKE